MFPSAAWEPESPATDLGPLAWAGRNITTLAEEIDQAIERILEAGRAGAHFISFDDMWVVNEAGKLLARVMPSMTDSRGGFAMDGVNVVGTVLRFPPGMSDLELSAVDHTATNKAQSAAARQRVESLRVSAMGYLEARREERKREVRELEETQRRLKGQLRDLEDMTRRLKEQDAVLNQLEQQQHQARSPVASGPGKQHPTAPVPRLSMAARKEWLRDLQPILVNHQTQGESQAQAGRQEFLRQHQEQELSLREQINQAQQQAMRQARQAQEQEDRVRSARAAGAAAASASLSHQQQQPNDLPGPTIPNPFYLPPPPPPPPAMSETSTHTLAAESIKSPPPDSSPEGEWTALEFLDTFGA